MLWQNQNFASLKFTSCLFLSVLSSYCIEKGALVVLLVIVVFNSRNKMDSSAYWKSVAQRRTAQLKNHLIPPSANAENANDVISSLECASTGGPRNVDADRKEFEAIFPILVHELIRVYYIFHSFTESTSATYITFDRNSKQNTK